jgi:hypothetical protein
VSVSLVEVLVRGSISGDDRLSGRTLHRKAQHGLVCTGMHALDVDASMIQSQTIDVVGGIEGESVHLANEGSDVSGSSEQSLDSFTIGAIMRSKRTIHCCLGDGSLLLLLVLLFRQLVDGWLHFSSSALRQSVDEFIDLLEILCRNLILAKHGHEFGASVVFIRRDRLLLVRDKLVFFGLVFFGLVLVLDRQSLLLLDIRSVDVSIRIFVLAEIVRVLECLKNVGQVVDVQVLCEARTKLGLNRVRNERL